MEKYFLYLEGVTLGVKYDSVAGTLTIGGYSMYRREIAMVCADYFDCILDKAVDFSMTQKNKCRYTFELKYPDFLFGLKKLEEHGFTFTKTKSLERIMR